MTRRLGFLAGLCLVALEVVAPRRALATACHRKQTVSEAACCDPLQNRQSDAECSSYAAARTPTNDGRWGDRASQQAAGRRAFRNASIARSSPLAGEATQVRSVGATPEAARVY